jgi:two-component system, NtrC family, nitrogen regulation response regulator GlnG
MEQGASTILVADDEQSVRWVLARALEDAGHRVIQAETGAEALGCLTRDKVDLAFVDLRMPDLDGLAVLSRAREAGAETPIVIITAHTTMANAIEAMKQGAYDYVTKPFDIDEVLALTQRAIEMGRLSSNLHRLEREIRGRFEFGVAIVGRSAAMQEIYKTIGRVAQTDATVLIQGESGTGKELIARVLHYHSNRWAGPFVALNCAAIPRDLLESELFGHERGAFTGASEQRAGKFELAHRGTLFLDEVADMPLELQAKLLRVLQEREVTRIGGRETVAVDCRIVAATNRALDQAVRQHAMREDLFYRLNVVPISVPPLRDRRGDIPELIDFFLDRINREMGRSITGISSEARDLLVRHDWPGNVRELENTLVRAAVLAAGPTLMPADLMLASREIVPVAYDDVPLEDVVRLKLKEYLRNAGDADPSNLYAVIMERIERPLIELVLERAQGNQLRAAALLGINRNTLRKKMTALKITPRRSSTEPE